MAILSETAAANKYRYDREYIKENYKYFSVALPKEEYQELKDILKENKLGNVEFVRKAIEKLKKKSL